MRDATFPRHALALEIPQRARIGVAATVQHPAEARVQPAGQLGMVDDSVRPAPELAVRLVVSSQEIARDDRRLIEPKRQTLRLHAVKDAEGRCLEQLAL